MKAPYTQLDSNDAALRAHACGLFSVLYLRRWASDGVIAPPNQSAIDTAVRDLRDAAGMTMAEFLARGTTMTEAEKAFEGIDFPGRLPPRMRLMLGGSVKGDLLPELRNGNVAVVAVNYAVIQDAGKGVTSFRGGHAVVVGSPDADSVSVADPLRKVIVRWPIALLERAMETFGTTPWGGGRGNAGVAYPSPTWREAYTSALRTIKRIQAELDAAQAKLVAVREQRDAAIAAEKLATATATEFRRKLGTATAEVTALTAGKAALEGKLAACEAAGSADCSAVEAERDELFAKWTDAEAALTTAETERDAAQAIVDVVRAAVAA